MSPETAAYRVALGMLTIRGKFQESEDADSWYHQECFRGLALSPGDVMQELKKAAKGKKRGNK